jgi:hypothetical protein
MQTETKTLRRFASRLGWPLLVEHFVEVPAKVNGGKAELVRWWESEAASGLFLQINERPVLAAAVYAVRFRIFTGWHPIAVSTDRTKSATEEAKRLHSLMAFEWFETTEQRRLYRLRNPVCAGYTWKRVAEETQTGLGVENTNPKRKRGNGRRA